MSQWMVPYEQLDDDQKDFVDQEIDKQGNIWVQGFAGSGKSVMLVHALIKKLKENPNIKACVVVYTHSLIDMFNKGISEIDPNNQMGLSKVPVMTYHQFRKGNQHYDFIFCDEVQDLPEDVLTEMRNRCNHLHVAGDSNQSIYDHGISPDRIGTVTSARPFILNRVYRLTRSIMAAVSKLLPNMDIFGSRRDMTKRDVQIRLSTAYDKEEEVKYVWEQGFEAASEGYSAAILLPTHDDIFEFVNLLLQINGKPEWELKENRWGKPDYENLNRHFGNNNIKMEYVGNSYGSFRNASQNKNLIIMTYHSAKGMDFDNVFLPFMSSSTYIRPENQKTLFMVAMTRSKMNLYITYSDYLHPLVERFESTCQRISLDNNNNPELDELDFGF